MLSWFFFKKSLEKNASQKRSFSKFFFKIQVTGEDICPKQSFFLVKENQKGIQMFLVSKVEAQQSKHYYDVKNIRSRREQDLFSAFCS